MPAKLSLTLDAVQYQQQLEAVVQSTRQAAENMSAKLNSDQEIKVSADTAPAEKSISVIPEAPDQEIIVTADIKPAEKALSELAKKQLEQTRIQNTALEEEKKERDKQVKYRSADNEPGRMRYAEEAKADYNGSSNPDDQIEAERKSVTAHAEIQTAKENIYSLERQIQKLEKEEAEASKQRAWQQQAEASAVKQKIEGQQYELEYNRLILAGEYDKVAALKKEAAEQRALRDAEKTKGDKLTGSEIELTRKLHDLSWNMQNLRDQQFGDLSIKTNSLTARGGFQGAAVVPDSDKYNREIAQTNKTMLNVLQRIETLCAQFGKF